MRRRRGLPGSRLGPGLITAAFIVVVAAAATVAFAAHQREQPVATSAIAAPPPQPEPIRAPEPRPQRPSTSTQPEPEPRFQQIRWRRSTPVGLSYAGTLERGVRLPPEGRHWFSWDPIKRRSPNRAGRRWGSDRLLRTTLGVVRRYAEQHPSAPRLAIGDLSRRGGGDFGPQFGGIGHASHQNGLDVDVYYPRTDRAERAPSGPGDVDVRLAQSLVDLFADAGAEKVFVGPSLPLEGPAGIVEPLTHHDDHLHLRLPPP